MAQKMRQAFYDLHAATLAPATTADHLAGLLRAAEGVTDRHRLSEGAVYASACRRYRMLTGRDWRAEGITVEVTTWATSDHRLRFREQPGNLWLRWACSCGATGECEDRAAGTAAHAEHRTAALVGA